MLMNVSHSDDLREYMESKGASSPGNLTLTVSLSKPFTRMERYPALLKELDRHMEVRVCIDPKLQEMHILVFDILIIF